MERDTKTKTIKVPREGSDEWTIEFREATKRRGERVVALAPNGLAHSVFAGEWEASLLPNAPFPEPVRIAAEELYWSNKTLAENEFRDSRGDLWQFKDPSFDSLSYRVFEEDCSGSRFHWTDWTKEELEEDGEVNRAALAWHRRAYTLAPDEARDERGMPIKMGTGEVRDPVTQRAMWMIFSRAINGSTCVELRRHDRRWDAWRPGDASFEKNHPCSDPFQLARVVEFYTVQEQRAKDRAVERIEALRILMSAMFPKESRATRLLDELEEIVRAKG